MASKTISGNVCNTYVHIDLILEEIGTDVNTNSSTVAWKLVGWLGKADSSYWYSNSYHTISVKVNGTTVYSLANTTAKTISIGTNHTQAAPTIIASGTTVVTHDSDGSKDYSASFSVAYRYNTAFTWSGSDNLALTTIPRATTPTVSATTVEMGGKITISMPRASAAFKHKLIYVLPNSDTNLAGIDGTIDDNLLNDPPKMVHRSTS